MRALLVDDSPTTRATLAAILRREGVVPETARNAEEALAAARRTRFDLVLSDVMMPGMNGFRLSRAIEKETGRHIPFVAYSGQEWEYVEEGEARAHVDAFFKLPARPDEVRRAIAEAQKSAE